MATNGMADATATSGMRLNLDGGRIKQQNDKNEDVELKNRGRWNREIESY